MRKSIEERFWSKVKIGTPTECWGWQAYTHPSGYGAFRMFGKVSGAHRVAWILTNGKIPSGLCVLHLCDNPACYNPAHLWLGTHADNMRDMYIKGRQGKAHRCGILVLNQEGREQVRELYSDGNFSQKLIAEIFGISSTTVRHYIKMENENDQ